MIRWICFMALVVGALTAAPASGASTKTFRLDVTPAKIGAHSGTHAGSATITNTGSVSKLGSANIYVPEGLVITEVSVSPPSSFDETSTPQVIKLRSLSLAQKDFKTVNFVFQAPTFEGDYTWDAEAKQSQTFAETDNFWLRQGTATTTVGSTGSAFAVTKDCVEKQDCEVQLRHYVDCDYVVSLDPDASCGGGSLSAADAAETDPAYWVETLVQTQAGGQLSLQYQADGPANQNAKCEVAMYDEPSDRAALFSGPPDKTVTHTISGALYGAANNGDVESCFSAPQALFTPKLPDPPFTHQETTWTNGLLHDCSGANVEGACVDRGNSSTPSSDAPNAKVVIEIPASPALGPDPMNY